ncbi:hypothetical protein EDB86DRAFT_2826928 [Lactarius hatsudake]|nr:hypothetical protein EDB86DRAFT_2826928 [Lactarius hatsudake]
MYPRSQQISRKQFGAAIDYLTCPPPESRYDGSTSLGVTVPGPLLPSMHDDLGSAVVEEMVGAGNSAPTLSAPLTQEYGAVTSPVMTPGAPQPYPPTWAPQINTAALPATTTGNPRECPICHGTAIFTRWQDRDRHLAIRRSLEKGPHGSYHIPGRKQFEIFDPQEFVDQVAPLNAFLQGLVNSKNRACQQIHGAGKSNGPRNDSECVTVILRAQQMCTRSV